MKLLSHTESLYGMVLHGVKYRNRKGTSIALDNTSMSFPLTARIYLHLASSETNIYSDLIKTYTSHEGLHVTSLPYI